MQVTSESTTLFIVLSETCETGRRLCQSHPDLCRAELFIELSKKMTSPCDMRDLSSPSPCEVPDLGFTDWFQKTATSVWETKGHVATLRFKEAKSAFIGNYANLRSGIGVTTLLPKTVAKLPFLIGNLFQVGSCLLSSPKMADKLYLLPPRGY